MGKDREWPTTTDFGELYELELQDRAKTRAKLKAAESIVQQLDEQLKPKRATIEQLRAEVVKSQKESMHLRNLLRIKNKENEQAKREVEKEQAETKTLRDRLIKAHERMAALEEAVKNQNMQGGPKKVNSSIRVLAASCEELHKRLADLRTEIRSNSPAPTRARKPVTEREKQKAEDAAKQAKLEGWKDSAAFKQNAGSGVNHAQLSPPAYATPKKKHNKPDYKTIMNTPEKMAMIKKEAKERPGAVPEMPKEWLQALAASRNEQLLESDDLVKAVLMTEIYTADDLAKMKRDQVEFIAKQRLPKSGAGAFRKSWKDEELRAAVLKVSGDDDNDGLVDYLDDQLGGDADGDAQWADLKALDASATGYAGDTVTADLQKQDLSAEAAAAAQDDDPFGDQGYG